MTPRIVGLDLGATGIRAAEVAPATARRPARVTKLAEIDLPVGAIDHGVIAEPKVVAKALRSLWRRGRFSTRRVVWGVDPAAVLTRPMDLPWMESEDFASALKFQVHDALPVDVRTVEVGYHLLEELGASALGLPETNRILVVATSSEGVAATASVLRQAGLHPVAADTHAFGLIRAACSASATTDASSVGATELLVDIGAQQLTMIIHRDGTPLLIRSVSHVAGEAAITAIADDLHIDAAQAEAEMVSTGINGPAPILTPIAESSVFASSVTATLPRTDPRTERITEVLGRWATTVVKEIQDSLDYYSSTSPETPVSRIRLMGRTSRLRGLSERITTQTLLPVVTMDSLAGLPAHGPATRAIPEDQRFALAVGLAL